MFKPREKRMLFSALILAGCWAAMTWVIDPLWSRHEAVQSEVELRTEKLNALSRIIERSSAIERRYNAIAPYLSNFSDLDSESEKTLLEALEVLSRQLTLPLNLKPRPSPRKDAKTFDVEVDLEGTQAQIFSFLDRVLSMPQLATVSRLSISAVPMKQGLLRANLIVQQIQL